MKELELYCQLVITNPIKLGQICTLLNPNVIAQTYNVNLEIANLVVERYNNLIKINNDLCRHPDKDKYQEFLNKLNEEKLFSQLLTSNPIKPGQKYTLLNPNVVAQTYNLSLDVVKKAVERYNTQVSINNKIFSHSVNDEYKPLSQMNEEDLYNKLITSNPIKSGQICTLMNPNVIAQTYNINLEIVKKAVERYNAQVIINNELIRHPVKDEHQEFLDFNKIVENYGISVETAKVIAERYNAEIIFKIVTNRPFEAGKKATALNPDALVATYNISQDTANMIVKKYNIEMIAKNLIATNPYEYGRKMTALNPTVVANTYGINIEDAQKVVDRHKAEMIAMEEIFKHPYEEGKKMTKLNPKAISETYGVSLDIALKAAERYNEEVYNIERTSVQNKL